MVSRLLPREVPVTITPENHPENAPAVIEEKPTTITLASAVGIGALCSLVGMTIGTAALSTAMLSDSRWELICLLPMVCTAVALLGGWVGAFFYMVRSDNSKNAP